MSQYTQTIQFGFQNAELELLDVYNYGRCDVRYVTNMGSCVPDHICICQSFIHQYDIVLLFCLQVLYTG
jgi:hypothetical protein